MDLIDGTAIEIAAALERGAVRSTDLAERWIARTEAARRLNCWHTSPPPHHAAKLWS